MKLFYGAALLAAGSLATGNLRGAVQAPPEPPAETSEVKESGPNLPVPSDDRVPQAGQDAAPTNDVPSPPPPGLPPLKSNDDKPAEPANEKPAPVTPPAAPSSVVVPAPLDCPPVVAPVNPCGPAVQPAPLPSYSCPGVAGPMGGPADGPGFNGASYGPGPGANFAPGPVIYTHVPGSFYPNVDGVHARFPYYSYRAPWYTPGPASANVTILW
jgi:hypothetical protein